MVAPAPPVKVRVAVVIVVAVTTTLEGAPGTWRIGVQLTVLEMLNPPLFVARTLKKYGVPVVRLETAVGLWALLVTRGEPAKEELVEVSTEWLVAPAPAVKVICALVREQTACTPVGAEGAFMRVVKLEALDGVVLAEFTAMIRTKYGVFAESPEIATGEETPLMLVVVAPVGNEELVEY